MKIHHFVLVAALAALGACDTSPRGDNATVTDEKSAAQGEGTEMRIDTNASSVAFTGWGVGKNHPGRFHLEKGDFTVKDGKITSGKFTIDINSLHMDQQEEMFRKNLRNHLLSEDFFNAAKYPEAYFEVTSTEAYSPSGNDTSVVQGANARISGNLTLKGVTKNISFPANVNITDDKVTAKANFLIDRTQWDMHYNEDKESAKDKFISPDVNIRLDITGVKK